MSDHSEDELFQPITTTRRNFEIVAETIRQEIYVGNLKPGQKLPNETELSRQFNVGRSAVREALKVLELSGLLEVRRGYNGGTFVAPPDFEETSEAVTLSLRLGKTTTGQLVEAREAIEVKAVMLAALRATDLEVADLWRYVEQMEEHSHIPARFIAADVEFHMAIAEMSRNNVFIFTFKAIRNLLTQDLNQLIRDRAIRHLFIEQHKEIAAAIEKKQPDAAAEAMQAHLWSIEERIKLEAN